MLLLSPCRYALVRAFGLVDVSSAANIMGIYGKGSRMDGSRSDIFEACVMTNLLRNDMIDNLTCLAFNLLTEVHTRCAALYVHLILLTL